MSFHANAATGAIWTTSRSVVSLLFCGSLLGCGAAREPEPETAASSRSALSASPMILPGDAQGASFKAVELRIPKRADDSVKEHAERLVGALLAKKAAVTVKRVAVGDDAERPLVAITEHPEVRIEYDPEIDGLEAVNSEVRKDHSSTRDVGPDEARGVYSKAVESLIAQGADLSRLDTANVVISRLIEADGRSDEAPRKRVAEYRFFAPLQIDGIGVTDGVRELGLKVAVHRNGSLASIRWTGLGVGPGARVASEKGVSRSVQKADQDRIVQSAYPSSEVVPMGMAYAAPKGGASGVVVPRQVYRVIPTFEADGRTFHGMASWVSYDLDKPGSPSAVWPKPGHKPGDTR